MNLALGSDVYPWRICGVYVECEVSSFDAGTLNVETWIAEIGTCFFISGRVGPNPTERWCRGSSHARLELRSI